jgi:uncharacterized protein DUF4430
VRRALLVLLAVSLAAALAFPASALALRVHVRVEGATTTIYGAAQPRVTPFAGELAVEGGSPLTLDRPTALGALESASRRGEFFYRLTGTSFGPYVSQIGKWPAEETSGWVYKVNGVSPPVGADAYEVKEGDEVLWYYATFGPAGGPLTLDLERAGQGCFQVFQVDDTGARSRAQGVVFHIGTRARSDADGRICPRGHWHRLTATKDGTVRSQAIVR